MTTLDVVFILVGALTLIASFFVIWAKKLVHAALWLIVALAGVATLFVLLEAGFMAVVQVAVYIDAIAVMIIIVVMLTQRAMQPGGKRYNKGWWLPGLSALLVFLALGGAFIFLGNADLTSTAPALAGDTEALLDELGTGLVDVDRFILPFEVASVLLLAAFVGAIMIAHPKVGGSVDEEVEA
jgi:NADH-quinone oxidoreductase subunit J